MEKVCLQCGDIGYENELICCIKCNDSYEHTYCIGGDLIRRKKSQVVDSFVCPDCQYSTTDESSSSYSPEYSRTTSGDQESDDKEEDDISSKGFKSTTPTSVLQDHHDYKSTAEINSENYYSFSDHTNEHTGVKGEQQSATSGYTTPAQPLIRPIWAGSFSVNLSFATSKRVEGMLCHVSTRSCPKVYVEASEFQPIIEFDLLPRLPSVWPKSFGESGPSDDNIAVYFFPSLAQPHPQEIYDRLIFDMIRDDLALKTFVQTAELLVFPSILLPSKFWRFQGKLYLWGVFRQKPSC